MSLTEGILSQKKCLKHTQTIVKTPEGRVYMEDGHTVHKMKDTCLGFVADDKPDLQVAEVLPGLYMGSQDVAQDYNLLSAHNITHVLSLGIECPAYENITYKFVYFLDLPEEPLSKILGECFQFIDESRNSGGCVFVHCNAGVSRSAAVVIAYVMKTRSLSFTEAYSYVKARRAAIQPNPGFVEQLKKL